MHLFPGLRGRRIACLDPPRPLFVPGSGRMMPCFLVVPQATWRWSRNFRFAPWQKDCLCSPCWACHELFYPDLPDSQCLSSLDRGQTESHFHPHQELANCFQSMSHRVLVIPTKVDRQEWTSKLLIVLGGTLLLFQFSPLDSEQLRCSSFDFLWEALFFRFWKLLSSSCSPSKNCCCDENSQALKNSRSQ